jgi:hypothetical protein
MKNNDVIQLTPAEEDPVVHRYLSALPSLAPTAGFEDRVMAQVWRPTPAWIQRIRCAAAGLFPRRRAWVWAGGLATASTCSLAIIIALMATNSVQVETAWSAFTGGLGLPAWRATISGTIGLVSSVVAYSRLITLNTTMLVSAGLGTALVMVVSLLGLHRTMQQHSSGRVVLHAGH